MFWLVQPGFITKEIVSLELASGMSYRKIAEKYSVPCWKVKVMIYGRKSRKK